MEREFIRVRSVKDIVIISTLAVAGITLTLLPVGDAVHIAGFFIIVAAAILAFVLKSAYKDVQTNERFCKTERYFQQAMQSAIASAIASKPDAVDLSEEDKGNALRLDIYYSKSSGKAYLQLFEYVPYTYEPCSKMFECQISNASKLIK